MFTKPTDIGELLECQFRHSVAKDIERNLFLYTSYGRSRAGRGRKYSFTAPDGHIARLTAYSDDEAIAKANARLAKILGGA